jgi:hypothetical protein
VIVMDMEKTEGIPGVSSHRLIYRDAYCSWFTASMTTLTSMPSIMFMALSHIWPGPVRPRRDPLLVRGVQRGGGRRA